MIYLDLCRLASRRIYLRGGKIALAGNLQIPRDIFLPTSAQSYICGSTWAVKVVVGAQQGMKVSIVKQKCCVFILPCSKFIGHDGHDA